MMRNRDKKKQKKKLGTGLCNTEKITKEIKKQVERRSFQGSHYFGRKLPQRGYFHK